MPTLLNQRVCLVEHTLLKWRTVFSVYCTIEQVCERELLKEEGLHLVHNRQGAPTASSTSTAATTVVSIHYDIATLLRASGACSSSTSSSYSTCWPTCTPSNATTVCTLLYMLLAITLLHYTTHLPHTSMKALALVWSLACDLLTSYIEPIRAAEDARGIANAAIMPHVSTVVSHRYPGPPSSS